MDIGQGAGLAGASGVRPFLPALLTGALASNDLGIDFDGTDFSFLESPWFLFVLLLLSVAVYGANRRVETDPLPDPEGRSRAEMLELVAAVLGIVLAALLFAGSLAAGDEGWAWGLIAGAVCGILGFLAIASLFGRARARLAGQPDAGGARSLLDIYAEAIGLALAALSLFVEPVGYLALAVFVFLIVRSRGERAQKYGGLRILR